MTHDIDSLATELETALDAQSPVPSLLDRTPDLSPEAAYQVQLAIAERKLAGGDRLLGYKAALTSAGMQAQIGIPEPMLGTLLASRDRSGDTDVSLSKHGFLKPTLEPEIALLMRERLSGPGATPTDVLTAAAGALPAIELGDYRLIEDAPMRLQDAVVMNTFNGGIVLGPVLTPLDGLDLRHEGMTLLLNGQPAGSGTGIEVLGSPLNSAAWMANKLAELGRTIEPGMVLMTGSIVSSVPLSAGDRVEAHFSRLGSVAVSITR